MLVTASTRGIGLACVKACAKERATVYMAARDLKRAQEIADTLGAQGACVNCVFNDATKPNTFSSMIEETVTAEGRIDVLVNNFGASDPGRDLDFAHTPQDVFLNTVMLNLRSVFLAGQAAVKHMAAGRGGSIINISSVGGLVPDLSQVAYGTSKAAINYLTKLIAVQEAKHQIRCNAVLPGMTATEAVEKHLTEEKQKGVAVIFVGEDLDVLLELCDRILVLCAGHVNGIVDGRTATKEEVGLMMTNLRKEAAGA